MSYEKKSTYLVPTLLEYERQGNDKDGRRDRGRLGSTPFAAPSIQRNVRTMLIHICQCDKGGLKSDSTGGFFHCPKWVPKTILDYYTL